MQLLNSWRNFGAQADLPLGDHVAPGMQFGGALVGQVPAKSLNRIKVRRAKSRVSEKQQLTRSRSSVRRCVGPDAALRVRNTAVSHFFSHLESLEWCLEALVVPRRRLQDFFDYRG